MATMIDVPKIVLGKYRITREIARSNDIVYEGVDTIMGRRVAIKKLMLGEFVEGRQKDERIERFYKEAKAAGTLTHPNIVTIYSIDEENDAHFIVMEYLEGQSLREVLKSRGSLPVDEILGITIQMCDALDHAHSHGVVHRDIKPDNAHVIADGVVKLTDFGIACFVADSGVTSDGMIYGTPSYMSPETIASQAVDLRSDVFSLGITLYEMLVGRLPFRGDSLISIAYQIMNVQPEMPDALSASLRWIIETALAKDLSARYQTCAQMAADLRTVAAGGSVGAANSAYSQAHQSTSTEASPTEDGLTPSGSESLPPSSPSDKRALAHSPSGKEARVVWKDVRGPRVYAGHGRAPTRLGGLGYELERSKIKHILDRLDACLYNQPLRQVLDESHGRAVDRKRVEALEDQASRAGLFQIRELMRIALSMKDRSQAPRVFRDALPVLGRALAFRGGEWSVRRMTVQALGTIWGNDEVISTLEYIVKNDRAPIVCVAAAEEIAGIGGAEATRVLINALNTKDDEVRRVVLTALQARPNRRYTIPFCQNALAHSDSTIRLGAATVLDRAEWKPADDEIQAWYLVAKRRWDDARELKDLAIRPLLNAIKGKHARVRLEAAELLGDLGWEPENPAMRGFYAVALQDWEDVKRLRLSATVALVNALEGEEADIRRAVADILVEFKEASVLALISVLRETRDPHVVQTVSLVLGKIARQIAAKDDTPASRLFIDAIPALTAVLVDDRRKAIIEPAHALRDIAVNMFAGNQIEGLYTDTLAILQEIASEQHAVLRRDFEGVILAIKSAANTAESESKFVGLFGRLRNQK